MGLIKNLEAARGNGTRMISLIVPPKDQVSRVSKMLGDEYGTASNIKSRVNRLSVLAAITSTQQKLKLYNKVPPNGLVVYCGSVITEEGKEKKVNIDFEPFKPINTSLYLCDNKFHTEALNELLESDSKYGFIIMDGNGALFGTLSGNTREILQKFSVDLPKKHGRGGQSALRFARLREEKRHNYVRKVAELAVQNFIPADKVNVAGIILAGSADFKNDLNQSDLFDNRLQSKVLKGSEGSEIILHTTKLQEEDRSIFMDKETGQEMEVIDQGSMLEWLAEKYRDFGANLEFVSDRSSEGNQFVKGFGGIGAILRYALNFEQLADFDDDEDEFYDD